MPQIDTILTVCIATYNRSNYLKLAIESVLHQTFKDFVVIILDNASTDDTEEVIKSFNSPKIIYHKHNENIKSYENLNTAFEVSKSKYLTIFHDDDIMLPHMLETQVNYLEQNSDVALVGCCTQFINEIGEYTNALGTLNLADDIVFNQFDYWRAYYLQGIYLPMPTVMYRKQFVDENSFRFRSNVGPNFDQYFWFEANLLKTKIVLLKEKLYLYRRHPNQLNDWALFSILLDRVTCALSKKYKLATVTSQIEQNKLYHVDYLIRNKDKQQLLLDELIKEGFFKTLKLKYKVKLFLGVNTPYIINIMSTVKHKLIRKPL